MFCQICFSQILTESLTAGWLLCQFLMDVSMCACVQWLCMCLWGIWERLLSQCHFNWEITSKFYEENTAEHSVICLKTGFSMNDNLEQPKDTFCKQHKILWRYNLKVPYCLCYEFQFSLFIVPCSPCYLEAKLSMIQSAYTLCSAAVG